MKKNCCFVNILIFSLLMFCSVSIFADDAKTESKIDFEGNTVRTTTSKDENDNDVITIETDYVGGKKKTSETKVTDVFNNVVSTKTHVYIKDEDGKFHPHFFQILHHRIVNPSTHLQKNESLYQLIPYDSRIFQLS